MKLKMENNKLIPYQAGLIKSVANAISVTNKLIAIAEPQLIPYRKKDKWGFCKPDKKIVIDCVFTQTEPFNNDYANIQSGSKWGLINKKGNIVIPCIYEYRVNTFSEGLVNVKKDGKYGFINNLGDTVIPFQFDDASQFSEGLARVKINGKYGFIDKVGKIVIPLMYGNVHSYNNGFANVRIDKEWEHIDKSGQIVADSELNYLNEIDAINKHLEINYLKIELIDSKYKILSLNNTTLHGKLIFDGIDKTSWGFQESMLDVQINDKYGFINTSGNLVIPCVYDDVYSFSDSSAPALKNAKWGYIDKTGKEIIPFIYDFNGPFENGIAYIRYEGYINKSGIQFWED